MALFPFLLAACADFGAVSRWRSQPMELGGPEANWAGADEEKFDGLTLRALNDEQSLYLSLSADSGELKQGLAGRRPWSLRFKPGKDGANAWGLRVQHLGPMQAQVFLMGAGLSEPRPIVDADGIAYAEQQRSGRLAVELKVPLRKGAGQVAAADCEPGEQLRLALHLPLGGEVEMKGSQPRRRSPGRRQGSIGGVSGGGGLPPSTLGAAPGSFIGNMGLLGGMNGNGDDGGNVESSDPNAVQAPMEAVLQGSVRLAKKPLYPLN